MNNYSFRNQNHVPTRTYTSTEYTNYRSYKPYLRVDFKNKCGYTHCLDHWFGGSNNFQIDHFLPQSHYPQLKTKYSNLIYCCSYVNRAKSNDLNLYLDPCDEDYNIHFYRDSEGRIFPISSSPVAVYMHKKLKLYLKRYSVIWMLEQLEESMYILQDLIKKTNDQSAKDIFIEITMKYNDYKRYLRA